MNDDSQPARAMRADGRRSRERILEAAEAVIARDGPAASLEEIARTAQVGSATLHRHFPSRSTLLEALFRGYADALAAAAETTVSTSPFGALRGWLTEVESTAARTAGLAAVLVEQSEQQPAGGPGTTCHDVLAHAGTRLLTAAQEAGVARPDARIDDLLTIAVAISALPDPAARIRMLDTVLDGLERH